MRQNTLLALLGGLAVSVLLWTLVVGSRQQSCEPALVQQQQKRTAAVVLYATSERHICACLAMRRRLRQANQHVRRDLRFHLLVPTTKEKSERLARWAKDADSTVSIVANYTRSVHTYYSHMYLKLEVFRLVQYDAILYIDADVWVLEPNAVLQLLDLAADHLPFTAARMYWGTGRVKLSLTSALMVLQPSIARFRELSQLAWESRLNRSIGDMQLVNRVFRNSAVVLPPEYFCLDSNWVDENLVSWPFRSTCRLVHFTAVGKPYMVLKYDMEELPEELRSFVEAYNANYHAVCPEFQLFPPSF